MEERKQIANELMSAIKNFNKTARHCHPNIGIKPSEMMLLFHISEHALHHKEGLRANELSEIMNVSTPTVTQLLNALEKEDYIIKQTDIEDKRAIRISLSEKAKTLIDKMHHNFFSAFYNLVEYMGEEDSKNLTKLLIKVSDYFKNNHKNI